MADAGDIARMLAARVTGLVHELLPRGRREGHEWRVGSIAGEAGKSLSVHLFGPRAGVWCDFASGDAGDALDLVAACLYGGDKRSAIIWARRWLGIGEDASPAARRPVDRAPRQPDPETVAEEIARRDAALKIWLAGAAQLAGTPAAAYLLARGIDLAELGRQPGALRFHPNLWASEAQRHYPALVAAVINGEGAHVATHRTWLDRRGERWVKAPLSNPKKSLGMVRGGAIPIWRGASGKPLRAAQLGETVAIAEGIETALSVALACPELRVLAAVSLSNMGSLALPAAIGTVLLCADNDHDNPAAVRALQRAVDHFAAEGRLVRVAHSPVGSDFNDLLQAAE